MILTALVSLGLVVASLVPPAPLPVPMSEPGAPPALESFSWAIHDESAAVKLPSWNADRRRPMASVTKRSAERRVGKDCRSRWSPDH